MVKRPTYEELLQRVQELEQEKLDSKLTVSPEKPGEIEMVQEFEPKKNSENVIMDYDLSSIINIQEIQSIMDDFYYLTDMTTAILDTKGRVIESTGWQDICTKFHRINAEAGNNCTKSDLYLASNLKPGEYRSYKCNNGLWDIVTPLYIGSNHLGNIYTGQFFYDYEEIDEKIFIKQAERFGFDKDQYLEALRRVPRYNKERINHLMQFLVKLSTYISKISFFNIQLQNEILERKKIEDELKNSETRLQTLIRTIPDLVWLKDGDGKYLICNSRFEKLFGARERDILGKTDYDFVDKKTADLFRKYDREVMHNGKPTRNEELVTFLDDGHSATLETIKTPMYRSDGHIIGVLGIGRDITRRKESDEERVQLMSAIEQSSESIVITDNDAIIRYINPAFEKITGFIRDEAIGRKPSILKSGKQDEAFYRNMWEIISSGKTWTGRFVNKKKDGTLFTEEASVSPVIDSSGRIVNYVSVRRDITEYLRMEKEKEKIEEQYLQIQKVESIGQLAGGVAHDLNNLLSPILGYGELLLDDLHVDNSSRKKVEQIIRAALGARELIKQLLAFSRKQTLEYKPVNINNAVTGFENLIRRTIREDIDIKIILSPDTFYVMADIGQIEQVIMNLSVNASDAMPKGGRLTIETSSVDLDESNSTIGQLVKSGKYAVLIVSDTGCGIEDEVLKHLFEPFFSTKGEQGTGLGLATVFGIIKQHGGNIWVYSEIGKGTTFKVYLPLSSHSTMDNKEIPVKNNDFDLNGNETILLVEDNDQVRDIVSDVLTQHGYKILVAKSGSEALSIMSSSNDPVSLLLTDVVMPEMNGKELFNKAEEKQPGLKVLYMSGYTNDVIAHQGILDEGVKLIEKPFSIEKLVTVVHEILQQN